MQRRHDAWQPPKPMFDRGWLQIYRRNVGPLPRGAVLVRDDSK
jgi:dihydroxy-acid dehydratase